MKIAFFDFDGTILTRDSGVITAVPSIRKRMLGPKIGVRLIGTYLASKVGLRRRLDAQLIGFECYGGKTLEQLREGMQYLHDNYLVKHISSPVRQRIEAHRKAGDRLVIITASAFFFAEPMGRELGFDNVLGTQMRFENGLCTGRVDGEIVEGAAKRAAAEKEAAAHGVELGDCTFYSDHIADLALLEGIGTPIAVGPHPPLAKIARERGWEILDHGLPKSRYRKWFETVPSK